MSENQFQLRLQKGPDPGAEFPLTAGSLTIGRDPMADITLNDPEVSRQHARMFETEHGYQIQDLGSTNGTFVNGEKISMELVDLTSGTTITFGSGVVLLFDVIRQEREVLETILDLNPLKTEVTDDAVVPDDMTDPDATPLPLEIIEDAPVVEPLSEAVAEFDLDVVSEFDEVEAVDDVTPEILESIFQKPVVDPLPEAVADFDLDVDVDGDGNGRFDFDEIAADYSSQDAPKPTISDPMESQGISAATDEPPKNRRTITIILAILFLIICCCCSLLVFMYYIGGDLIINELGA